jgi:2-polyprenyl-3-methyl-5-hydroxy-6-metoxy-1,4-benzoquinol methylase
MDTDQLSMLHELPPARLVERTEHLCSLASGTRVVHLGFADAGFRDMQERSDAWLHAHLAQVAAELVGIDVDERAVAEARSDGYEAYVADCCDLEAVRSLEIDPAPVVIAGELIEHLDAPGSLLRAAHPLVASGGRLVITTPNAYGWLNVVASLGRREINHPEHVAMFTRRTLEALAARHGWQVDQTSVYVPEAKAPADRSPRARALHGVARSVCAAERLAARIGRPYACDGLIVELTRR